MVKTQHANALLFQPRAADRILCILVGAAATIAFHGQMMPMRAEVDDEMADGMRSAKLQTAESATVPMTPEQPFGKRRILSKLPHAVFCMPTVNDSVQAGSVRATPSLRRQTAESLTQPALSERQVQEMGASHPVGAERRSHVNRTGPAAG